MRCTPVFGLKLKPWEAAGGVIDMQFHALINPIAPGFLFSGSPRVTLDMNIGTKQWPFIFFFLLPLI